MGDEKASVDGALVLLADDDQASVDALRSALRAAGVRVVACRRALAGIQSLDFHRPSAVVVDPGCDGGRGWDLLREARRDGRVPVLALARDLDDAGRRTALAAGAHEVVAKPFDAEEIAARVIALVRLSRAEARSGPIYRHSDLVVDVAAHAVRVGGRAVELTPQQFAILRALCEAGGATLGRSQLLARIAGLDDEPASERAIDLHVTRLRRRLGDTRSEPRFIETVYGVGYRLASERAARPDDLADRSAEVLDAVAEPMLVVDASLTVRFANVAAERLLGQPRGALVGQRCGRILECRALAGQALDGPRCFGRAVLANGPVLRRVEAIVRGADGDLPVELSYGRAGEGGRALLAISLRPHLNGA